MQNIYYKVKVSKLKEVKGKKIRHVEEILVPIEVKEGSINTTGRFGRKDCTITPIGGKGELNVDYYSLIVK